MMGALKAQKRGAPPVFSSSRRKPPLIMAATSNCFCTQRVNATLILTHQTLTFRSIIVNVKTVIVAFRSDKILS